jgi:hypothetical protein
MKKMTMMMAALGVAALVTVGCGKEDDHDHDHGKAGSGKDDGHAHKDGDHGHEHEGEAHDLGTQDVGGYPVKVVQRGDAKAGGEAVLECTSALPKGKDITGVVAWLGDAAGVELSARAKADKHGDGDFDAHVSLPKEIPADSKYWIEATFADGKTAKGSWDMKK